MFTSKKETVNIDAEKALRDEVAALKQKIKDQDSAHLMEMKEIEHTHKLALKEKEFELKHFKDNKLKAVQDEFTTAEKTIEVLKKENEMLVKITDLNADIIDVKELVNALIKKLPEVNLQSLTVNHNGALSK